MTVIENILEAGNLQEELFFRGNFTLRHGDDELTEVKRAIAAPAPYTNSTVSSKMRQRAKDILTIITKYGMSRGHSPVNEYRNI